MQYQQNLEKRKIADVVLGVGRWRPIKPAIQRVVEAVDAAKPGTVTTVDIPLRNANVGEARRILPDESEVPTRDVAVVLAES